MKRLLTLAAMFLCCIATSFAQYSGSGSGTEDDPYLIFNENQLSQVSNFLNQEGVVFKLMKDLDLTEWIEENNPRQGWLPIGVESSPFMGKFWGNNHKITGLSINRKSTNHVGFFGYVSNATIENFTIEGTSVVGGNCVGCFIGSVYGSTITNCHVKMKNGSGVKGNSKVGGFAGCSNDTNYETFSVAATVNSSENNGGFAGKVESGTFSDGSYSGELTGTGSYTGGLIGNASGLTLADIVVKGSITGKDYTGGIVGCNVTGTFTNCKYEGELNGTQYVGGIVGALENTTSTFTSCFSKGIIIATGDYAGGIIGVSQGACIEEMESCSHFGDISGQSYIGGLVGAVLNTVQTPTLHTYESRDGDDNSHVNWYSETMSTGTTVIKSFNNCTAIGNIMGITYIGGLIGSETTANGYTSSANTINDKYSHLFSSNFGRDHYVGYVNCPIYDGETQVGSAPFTYYDYTRNTISLSLTNNYYSGTLQGTDNVGGLVGYKSGGIIQNNYAYANIYGSSYVGGIVGQVSSDNIGNSYNTTTLKSNVSINGIVSATTTGVGRVYGYTDNSEYSVIGTLGSAEGNRALAQTKVILQGVVQEVEDDFQNGTSIGPSLLRRKATYVSMGWDCENDWNILETESYPYKNYQAAPPVIESNLVSQATNIKGKSLNGGTVYLYYKDYNVVSTRCSGNDWTFATEPLQSGAPVQIYADVEGMTPSYFATTFVGYPGSGTEADPYRIYTAEDLQGASNRGYYKVMNDIDLTQWINENSPNEGWQAIGRNSGEATYIDGDGHKVTGLWMNTTQNYNGLFSNFSAGQIKNLTVEVAEGKKVKGGDYTGVLIGRNANGRIVNCTVKGDVEGTNHTGGVAGLLVASEIRGITFDGSIASSADNAFVGGLAGQTEECEISACNIKSVINLSGTGGKAGGLIGESKDGIIKKSMTQTTLTATGANCYTGGLVGYSETPITLCSSAGTVTASGETTYSGGLVGYALSPIDNSFSTANTTGTEFSAGLVGYTFSTIDKCYASGNVYGYMYGAGVVGELDGPNARLTNSVALNNILSLTAQTSWGCRVIGGFKNGASDPDESNLALSTMQVSLNGVAQKKTDDIVEGKATTSKVLKTKKTYTTLGWDFTDIWEITEGTSYPVLQIDGVRLDQSEVIVKKKNTVTLTATVYPSTLEDKSVTWKSSDKTIATVSSSGVVKGIKSGVVTITCTSKATGLSATCEVTVATIALNKSEVIVKKKKSVTLKPTVYPTTLADKSVKWKSSDKTIATVSSSGKVTGVKSGVVTITCTSNATGVSTTCKVTVATIALNKKEAIVRKKKTLTLTPTVYPTTLEDKSVTWKSSDESIATVSSDGVVTGVKSGVVTITCTSNATGVSTTCTVTVGTITLNKSSVTLAVDNKVTLKPTVYPTTLEDQSVTWKSSNKAVATVSKTGKVTALKAGTATITCTSNATGLSTTCKVTVTASASARTLDDEDSELTDIEIAEVAPDAEEPFDVYDLKGHRVLHQVTSLDGLPAGVYIVNGKKVLKK